MFASECKFMPNDRSALALFELSCVLYMAYFQSRLVSELLAKMQI